MFIALIASSVRVAQNILKFSYLNIASADRDTFTFANGIRVVFQNDGNFVAYRDDYAVAATASNSPGNKLVLIFQEDGNLVVYNQGKLEWASGTGGTAAGADLVIQQVSPYIRIIGSNGYVYYTAREG